MAAFQIQTFVTFMQKAPKALTVRAWNLNGFYVVWPVSKKKKVNFFIMDFILIKCFFHNIKFYMGILQSCREARMKFKR